METHPLNKSLINVATTGNLHGCEHLIGLGANVRSREGQVALQSAIRGAHIAVCELLIKHGANILAENETRTSPAQSAVTSGNLSLCGAIFKAAAAANNHSANPDPTDYEAIRVTHFSEGLRDLGLSVLQGENVPESLAGVFQKCGLDQLANLLELSEDQLDALHLTRIQAAKIKTALAELPVKAAVSSGAHKAPPTAAYDPRHRAQPCIRLCTPPAPIRTVFVSYDRRSTSLAFHVRDALRSRGFRVPMDGHRAKGDIMVWMSDHVRTADVVLALLTDAYEQTEACRNEFEFAMNLGKRVVPLRAEANYVMCVQFREHFAKQTLTPNPVPHDVALGAFPSNSEWLRAMNDVIDHELVYHAER